MADYYETIIVGGGPAGSSCAWKLNVSGYSYYLYANQGQVKQDNCFLIGD